MWRGERINPTWNCFRWYQVWVQQDLFGDWAVWTAWGRIGAAAARQRLRPATNRSDAQFQAQAIVRRKTKRGYQTVWRAEGRELS